VKLLDFGLARAEGEGEQTLTKLGTILGTPGYMAPEQARAEKVDARCDLFSLGAVLYRMLTGALPFKGKDPMSALASLLADTPRLVREVNPEVPPSLADLVTRLLAKNPDERPASARAVAEALATLEAAPAQTPAPSGSRRPLSDADRAILEEPTRLVKPEPILPATGRSPRSSWRIALLTGGGLLTLLMLILLLSVTSKTPDTHPSTALAKTATTFTKPEKKDRPFAERPKSITNSIGMKLVLVEPGTFLMGSPEEEVGHLNSEHQHEVEITRPFYVGVYEVTQEQYERVMGENPSWFSSTGRDKDKVQGMDTRQFPVENVSWEGAARFCRRLSELPQQKANERLYRLPTEAEWEYVCRGGPFFKKPSPPFYFGNSLSSTQANFDGNHPYGGAAKGAYLERTTKVGSYPSNPLGVYDLHGNVWEWCADRYDADYYKHSPKQEPQGPDGDEHRVMRGGSWYINGWSCRAAFRINVPPNNLVNGGIGFRVVLNAGARTP
jgi:formylglycine-generating enzyme required for sulfatase activity